MSSLELPKLTRVTQNWPPLVRYACSLGIVALITALELSLWTGSSYPFVLSIVAVIASAALFGQWAGIFATVLSAVISTYFFVAPIRSINLEDVEELLALITFIGIGLSASVVINTFYRAIDELSKINSELSCLNTRLINSDKEKDVLLQEIAHRYKNDLTMLIAMINLERRGTRSDEAAGALDAISSRIRVLSRLQDRLVRSHTEALVSSYQFINDLCGDLKCAFADLRPIRLNLEVEDHHLPQERAVALGLIINELVTNSLKYAFPEGRPGAVHVRFIRGDDVFYLTVKDDGIGIDKNAKPAGTGLGQRLLKSMAAQLNGNVEVESGCRDGAMGTLAVLRFPVHS